MDLDRIRRLITMVEDSKINELEIRGLAGEIKIIDKRNKEKEVCAPNNSGMDVWGDEEKE